MNPARRDVSNRLAGAAHAGACPSTTAVANRWGMSARNARHWKTDGPPVVRAFLEYLRSTDDPYQVVADINARVKQMTVERLTTEELILRYKDLVVLDKEVESANTIAHLDLTIPWADVHRTHRIDGAVDLELAGVIEELMVRRVERS